MNADATETGEGSARRTRFVAVAALLLATLHLLVPLPSLALVSVVVLFLFVVPAAIARRPDGSCELLQVLALAPISIAAAAALRAGLVTAGLAPGIAARATSLTALGLGLRWLWPMVVSGERRLHGHDEPATVGARGLDRRLVVGVLAGALLLALPLLSTRVLVSWHGFFHAALTEQIAARGLPATNPGMAGEPIAYHWAFHAIPALIAETAAIDPLRALLGLNVAWIVVAGLGAAELARSLGLARTLQRIAPLALFGALNTAAPLVLLAKRLAYGALPSNPWSRGEWIDWLSQRAIPRNDADVARSLWDVRASCFAKEFLDASAMATGLTLVVVALALVVEAARAPRGRTWLLAPLVLIVAWIYPQLLPAVVVAVAALGVVLLRPRPRFALALAGACALALAIATPYLLSIASRARFVESADAAPFVAFETLAALARHVTRFAAFAALLPFFVPAAHVLWTRRREPTLRALMLVAVADLLLVVAFRMQQGVEYKFLYAAAVPLALIALLGLDAVVARGERGRTILAASALYLAGPTVVFLAGALASGHFGEQPLVLHGRTVARTPERPIDPLLAKVRLELPPDTVLVAPLLAPPVNGDKSPNNDAFAPAALAARDLYLVDDRELTRRLLAHDERARLVDHLMSGVEIAAATAQLKTLRRPIALLLEPTVNVDLRPTTDAEWAKTDYAAAGWRRLDHRDGVDLLFLPAVR